MFPHREASALCSHSVAVRVKVVLQKCVRLCTVTVRWDKLIGFTHTSHKHKQKLCLSHLESFYFGSTGLLRNILFLVIHRGSVDGSVHHSGGLWWNVLIQAHLHKHIQTADSPAALKCGEKQQRGGKNTAKTTTTALWINVFYSKTCSLTHWSNTDCFCERATSSWWMKPHLISTLKYSNNREPDSVHTDEWIMV